MNEFIKINKIQALKQFTQGISIYIVSSKVYPDFNNNWLKPYEINITRENIQSELKEGYLYKDNIKGLFDSIINNFSYYNCNYELGYTVHYYILDNNN